MSETVRERIVKPICSEPLSAAWSGRFAEFDVAGDVFQSWTMASSTTKPVEIVSAMRERLFKLKLSRYMTPKGADDGERNSDAGNNCGANAAEE